MFEGIRGGPKAPFPAIPTQETLNAFDREKSRKALIRNIKLNMRSPALLVVVAVLLWCGCDTAFGLPMDI